MMNSADLRRTTSNRARRVRQKMSLRAVKIEGFDVQGDDNDEFGIYVRRPALIHRAGDERCKRPHAEQCRPLQEVHKILP